MIENKKKKKINKDSKLYKDLLGNNKPVIMDVGARNGVHHKFLNELAENSLIKLVLIELDKFEAKKLQSQSINVIDKALWYKKELRKVFLTKNKSYTSTLKPNKNIIKGSYYYDREFYDIVGIDYVKTTTINEIIRNKKNKIDRIDFLKIDIQGAESKIFKSFTKKNWDLLLGCKTEAYSAQVYENCETIEYYFNKFYNNNFETYKIENISSLIRTSYKNKKIYGNEYMGARPNTKFNRGRQLTFDLLFFKKIEFLIKKPNINQLRIFLFLLVINNYFDQAFYILLIFNEKKIIPRSLFLQIKSAIRLIFHSKLGSIRKFKEIISLKNYNLKNF